MNVLTTAASGSILFDSGTAGGSSHTHLSAAAELSYDGTGGIDITSHVPGNTDRFNVRGASGTLFSVNDALTGTVFSVNDAAGLPIIEVNSNSITDTIALGEYGTNALFVSAGNVGIGTATPTSPLHVCGNIAVTGTVDGRDIVADGSKLDGIACGAGTGTVTSVTAGNAGIDIGGNAAAPTVCIDLTEITLGAGLDSTTTGLSLDLSELTDMTAAVVPTQDELILLDSGAERRKLFSEIFGCNAYNSTAFTTCLGNVCTTGTQSIAGVKSFSSKIGADGGIDGLTLANGGITGSNYNISGVNQLTISDPGEGIVWGGGANTVYLYAIDDATDNVMNFCGASELRVNNSKVWTAANDGSGSGLDADLIDSWAFRNTGSNAGMNADTIDSNGITYYNGGVINFSGNANDGALYSQRYSSSWQHQIAGDYRSGQIAIRGKNNGTWQCWYKVWSENNDGAGSGLDADLLDGCQGSFYNQSGCLGINCTGTGVGNITCITTNTGLDGSGSSGTVNITLDLTEITLGAGLDSTTTGLTLDLSELTDMTAAVVPTTDELILLDNGAERRKRFSEIFGSNAYNSTAFTTCIGDITAVTAGAGLCGGGTSGAVTLCHCDTSSQGSVNNSSGTVIQDVTLDTFGHVTALGSYNLDGRYYTETEVNGLLSGKTPYNDIRSLGTRAFTNGANPNITTAQVISEIESDGGFDSFSSVFKTSWSYAGNYNLTDAGRFTETAGSSWLTWTDNSSDTSRGQITALAIAPTTGGSAGKVFIYNDQGGSYSPGWREVWTNTSDGAGSGLDADLLDGCHATAFQAAGTYNTIIGTDSDINTSGCQVVDQLVMTDGVITSHSTRNITLANLGYTGATNATSCTGTVCNLANLGITSTAAEVNYTTDVTSNIQAQLNGKLSTSGCAANSQLLDGIDSSAFLRSNATDTATGALTLSNAGNTFNGHHYFSAYDAAGNHYPHYMHGSSGGARVNLRVYCAGGGAADVLFFTAGNNNMTWRGNKIWNAGNDGAGSGLDADLLDGIDSASFLRSNAADTFTSKLTMGTQRALVANNFGRGVYGLYNSSRYQHVWGMGESWNLADDGTATCNFYGLTYTHTNVGGQSKAGLSHQLLVMTNGATATAIGSGIWTAGDITVNGGDIILCNTGRIQGIDTVSATTDATNKTYVDTCLATKQASGTYNTIIGTDSDINTSGCQVVDQLVMTDGVLTSHSTRNLTLGNLGYTGATNANYITNNNQLTNGAGYITSSGTANNSTCAGGLVVGTGRNNSANQIVRTQSNGYAEFGWINTTSGNTTSTITDFYVNTNDGYIRKATKAHVLSQLNVASGATACTGTTTASNSQTFTNKSGCISQWNNNSGYTTCIGDVTGVTAGTGMTGGGTSGTPTLNVIGGTGITANANDIAVDSTVVRTTGTQTICSVKTFCGSTVCVKRAQNNCSACDAFIKLVPSSTTNNTGNTGIYMSTTTASSPYGVSLNAWRNPTDQQAFTIKQHIGTAAGYDRLTILKNGYVGIGTTTPSSKLQVNGTITGTTKNFLIDNPKTGGELQYSVIESNEHGVSVRGESGQEEIQLPDEWEWLVHEDSVTVHLTSIDQVQHLFVLERNNIRVRVGGIATNGQYSYVISGTRKDVDPLEVNIS